MCHKLEVGADEKKFVYQLNSMNMSCWSDVFVEQVKSVLGYVKETDQKDLMP